MSRIKSVLDKIKWYLTNPPVVSTVLFVVIIVCYKIRLDRHFSDVALCVQPHMVMTGQASRLIKYVVHHKNVQTLILSLVFLAIFGTVSERQAGSFRFLFLMTVFAVLSSSLTVFFSILLGFSSHYSSLMYSCPALGLTPALFGIIVLVFKSLPMKKSILFYIVIPNQAVPWLMLIASQVVIRDSTFISNLSGCIIGSLYICGMRNILSLPTTVTTQADRFFQRIFKYIPILKYIPGTAPKLPQYHGEMHENRAFHNHHAHQPFPVPDDCPVPIAENSVTQYKLNKLIKMGFNKEESVVALAAASNNMEVAVSILTNKQTGQQAIVMPAGTSK